MCEYQKQASDFLKKTKTAFTANCIGWGFHFEGDTDKRQIFSVTLKNDRHEYTFQFGAALKDPTCTPYDVLACLSGSPSIADMDYEEFCDNYGYEKYDFCDDTFEQIEVSRKIFEACKDEAENVIKLFGDCLEDLAEIQ